MAGRCVREVLRVSRFVVVFFVVPPCVVVGSCPVRIVRRVGLRFVPSSDLCCVSLFGPMRGPAKTNRGSQGMTLESRVANRIPGNA